MIELPCTALFVRVHRHASIAHVYVLQDVQMLRQLAPA